jgi:hypothetical protein
VECKLDDSISERVRAVTLRDWLGLDANRVCMEANPSPRGEGRKTCGRSATGTSYRQRL